MEEIPNNHLGCIKPVVNNGINHLSARAGGTCGAEPIGLSLGSSFSLGLELWSITCTYLPGTPPKTNITIEKWPLKMYLLFKMGLFHCHVGFRSTFAKLFGMKHPLENYPSLPALSSPSNPYKKRLIQKHNRRPNTGIPMYQGDHWFWKSMFFCRWLVFFTQLETEGKFPSSIQPCAAAASCFLVASPRNLT